VIDANSGEVLQNYEWESVPEDRTTSTTSNVPIVFLYLSIAIVMLILPLIVWRIFKRKK
jgi:hypothetical protein